MKKVGIVMGSDSDMPVAIKAVNVLKELEVPCEVHIYSAHRTPDEAKAFAETASGNGFGVLIGIAGMAAHLAGALAANTVLPVIGLPVKSKELEGLDALLSTVQMPPGMPVATVGVDAGKNAGLLAAQIISLEDKGLQDRIKELRMREKAKVLEKDKNVEKLLNE